MKFRLLSAIVVAIAVAGCSYMPWNRKPATTASKPAPAPQPAANTAAMPAQAESPAASQSSSYMQIPGAYAIGGVPPMEPNRRINTQDCTKEVDITAGNLNCR
jgi:hypothetical protein